MTSVLDEATEVVPFWRYLEVIEDKITNHPRSLQKRIGPSELGTPCERKLGLKLSGAPEGVRDARTYWRPQVGTAVHVWLEEAFEGVDETMPDGGRRFLTETRVTVGEIDGEAVAGSCDLFDRLAGAVIDWKIVGKSTLDRVRRSGQVSDTYRTQAHLYGRGYAARGERVHHVVIAFLPSAGDLTDAVWWTEPYDESVALDALDRADVIAAGGRVLGWPKVLDALPRFDDYCRSCAFHAVSDSETTCAGVPTKVQTAENFFD